MDTTTIAEQIAEQVATLPPEDQKRVIAFVGALAVTQPKGVPGRDLLRFAGTVSEEDADLMTQAIDEGCEQVHGAKPQLSA